MAYSIATLAEQLSQWQHPSSTRLQALDLLNRCRRNPEPLEDPDVHDALERGSFDTKLEVLQYDAEIEELEKRLDALRQTQSLLNSCSDACKSLSARFKAPIRRIPDDILLTIFEMACTDPSIIHLGREPRRHPKPRDPRHELASVCYRWREIILSAPFFWNNIRMLCKDEPTSQWLAETQLRSLTEHILRSKLCPLRITMKYHPSEDTTPFWSSVLNFLEPHFAARCQSITFLGIAMPFNGYQMPWISLHSLRIQNHPSIMYRDHQHHTFTVPLPVLRELQLEICPSRLNFKLGIEWHMLTRLEAHCWEIRELYHILPQCINLEELKISRILDSEDRRLVPGQFPHAQTSLSCLRLLSLDPDERSGSNIFSNYLLPNLRMPSLQALDIQRWSTRLSKVDRNLQALAYCPLTSLTISTSPIHLPGLQGLLKDHFSLETLSLDVDTLLFDPTGWQFWQSLEALFIEMTNPIFLPKLTAFKFQMYMNSDVPELSTKGSYKALVDMARSRHNPPLASVSRLRILYVDTDAWNWDEEKELRKLLKELKGMKVIVKSG